MSIKYFDAEGMCVASFTKNDVYKNSRKYFQLDKNRIKNIQLNENFDNNTNIVISLLITFLLLLVEVKFFVYWLGRKGITPFLHKI